MPFYNFGLEGYVGYALYGLAIAALLAAVCWRPVAGLYFLTPLLPLQTVRYRLNGFPWGESVVYVMLLGIGLGLWRKGKPVLPATPWTRLLVIYCLFTFASLWAGAWYLGAAPPLPGDPRFADWLAYMTMPALFFVTASAVANLREARILLALMCLAMLQLDRSFWGTVSGRDFSSYSQELRDTLSAGGSMGYAGVNGLAAFEAQAATFLLTMAACEPRRRFRLAYLGLAAYSALCLMYSLSRGAYAAFLAGWLFLGLVKQRLLLVVLAVFALVWTAVVPQAVVERVRMTRGEDGQLDHSAELRIALWEDSWELIRARPALGTGFNTYPYLGRVGSYRDTHNYYLEVLVETGVAGLALFVALLARSFLEGWRLFRGAKDPLWAGVGLGVAGWVICAAVSNAFGDRWTYLQIQGFFWVLAGLAARGHQLNHERASAGAVAEAAVPVLAAR